MRREGHWVQLLGVTPGAGSRQEFIPFSVLDFLPLELSHGLLAGNCAGQRLKAEQFAVDRWVTIREFQRDPGATVQGMKEQFRPRIDAQLTNEAINAVVDSYADDWGCVYGDRWTRRYEERNTKLDCGCIA